MDKIITPKNNTDKNIITIDFTKINENEINKPYIESLTNKLKINRNNVHFKLIDEENITNTISFYWPGINEDYIVLKRINNDVVEQYLLYNGSGSIVDSANIVYDNQLGVGYDKLQYLGIIQIDAKKLDTNENCALSYYLNEYKEIYNKGLSSTTYNPLISQVIAIIENSTINGPSYGTREILTIGEYHDNYCILENENYKFKLNSDGTIINIGKTNPLVFYDTSEGQNAEIASLKLKNTKAKTALMYDIDKILELGSSTCIIYVFKGWFLIPAAYSIDQSGTIMLIANMFDKAYVGQLDSDGTLNMEEYTENTNSNLINNVKQS